MANKHIAEILEGTPDNWGRWGSDDEIGSINYLDNEQVLRGVKSVSSGETFTLGLPVFNPNGDFKVPVRMNPRHHMNCDKGYYESGKAGGDEPTGIQDAVQKSDNAEWAYTNRAGLESADDSVYMNLHTPTHIDALAHCWYDDQLYNGFDANSTKGGLEYVSIEPMASHGIVGRGVLLDIPRYRGEEYLQPGSKITVDELKSCAESQNTEIKKNDIIILRTGWIELYENEGEDAIDYYDEPGITASDETLEWFHDMEIPFFGSDTLRCEKTIPDEADAFLTLHAAFLRNLGIPLNELLKLDHLSKNCADDGKYDFLFIGAPLKLLGATGSPVNPIAIK